MNVKSFLNILKLNHLKIRIIDDNFQSSIYRNLNEIPVNIQNRSIFNVYYCVYIHISIDFMDGKIENDISPIYLHDLLPILGKTHEIELSSNSDINNEIEYLTINSTLNSWYIKFKPTY